MAFRDRFKKAVIVAIALVSLASYGGTLTIDLDEQWEIFKNNFHKIYETECEEEMRRQIFEKNVELITMHNLEENMGLHSFTLGINKMTDLRSEERHTWDKCYESSERFRKLQHDIEKQNDHSHHEEDDRHHEKHPKSEKDHKDYRTEDMVTEVMDQGECNSCYAFAALGALEAQMKKKTGKLVPLSVQNVIDCSKTKCQPRDIIDAYEYVQNNNGVASLESYAYNGKNNTCKFDPDKAMAKLKNFSVLLQDEDALRQAVEDIGPISVGIKGDTKLFQHYKGGIFEDPDCEGEITHAVLIIGYGGDEDKPYWIAKNSFGKTWGEHGFFKIARGHNMCRIADAASYPLV